MRFCIILFLLGSVSGALVENGAVRVRYGSPILHQWARIVFDRPTTFPDLENSDSFDTFTSTDFVSLQEYPFKRTQVQYGNPSLNIGPYSEFLYDTGCVVFSSHGIELVQECKQCQTVTPCFGEGLCTFNITEGMFAGETVELFADVTELTSDISKELRFGSSVSLGPIHLRDDTDWLRNAVVGPTTRLSLDSVVFDQIVYINLNERTVCTHPRRIERHNSWGMVTLNLGLMFCIAGLYNRNTKISKIVTPTSVVLGVTLLLVVILQPWVPLRIKLSGAYIVFAISVLQMVSGIVFATLWFTDTTKTHLDYVSMSLWVALWYIQFQTDASTWDTLTALIVLGLSTWVNWRKTFTTTFGLIYVSLWQTLLFICCFTLRNPLQIQFPLGVSVTLVALGIVVVKNS